MRALARAALLALAAGTSACSLFGGAQSAEADADAKKGERSGLAAEADRLLEADRAFATRAAEAGWDEALAAFADPDAVAVQDAPAAARLLSWEPRYAEVFAPGDWGWTWGEWQAHEPGAGGRRTGQGRYVSVWKKRGGSWKRRSTLEGAEAPR